MGWIASVELRDGRRKRFFVAGDAMPASEAKLQYVDGDGKTVVVQTPNGQGWSSAPDDQRPADATLATVV